MYTSQCAGRVIEFLDRMVGSSIAYDVIFAGYEHNVYGH